MVNRDIRHKILGLCSLHHVITHTGEALENREVTFGAFLDIEGAFDNTSFYIITETAKQHHGLGDTVF
jgi:hypothetical protein